MAWSCFGPGSSGARSPRGRGPARHRPIGAGYDKIDLEACTEHGVALFNAPLALNHPTAHRRCSSCWRWPSGCPQQERVTRQGRWDLQAAVMGSEILGRTLGIIGLGKGQRAGRLVAPFAMRILAYSPHADPARPGARRPPDFARRGAPRVRFLSLHAG